MVINIKDVPGVKVPAPNNRVLKTLMCPELDNCDEHTILISIIESDSSTGVHTHEAAEYMYVATGRGEAVTIEDGEEVVEPIEPDCLIYAPEGVEHDVRNLGDETLKLFCVYTPAIEAEGKFLESIEIQKK
ncbi:cupin domain-containing protein [Acetohalobium arabaticum]|uniref:Cupin 2 conserved barrel domain protein n=1 Tax=Acetohalobium arabaticum (strain ATCC 49924 / DSM 5501 / Z-7288) TaxID=574087 RepID=D9QPN2_ACEAZ|nr:cupin domain-containing protein [Acetohalobium arabaticum]ADL12473.1 Cupin 2 conserved barrel domain protein [Acetohalobium arabaticum DSM 5501]